jgi:hypothetical protein
MRKRVFFIGVCFLLATSICGVAQQNNDSDIPDKAEVLKFLDLMHARAQMVQVLDGMAKQMRIGAEEGFKRQVPDATPEQLAKVDKMCDTILGSMPVDEMMDAVVPIYQKHLTKTDLAAITAFYSSPAGQKILKELPAIMSEAMQAGGEIGRKAAEAKMKELDAQVAELAKTSKQQ